MAFGALADLFRMRVKSRPLRRGLYEVKIIKRTSLSPGGKTISAQAEVAEQERLGEMSRVEVVRVTGVEPQDARVARSYVPAWIKTEKVKWFDEQTQGN